MVKFLGIKIGGKQPVAEPTQTAPEIETAAAAPAPVIPAQPEVTIEDLQRALATERQKTAAAQRLAEEANMRTSRAQATAGTAIEDRYKVEALRIDERVGTETALADRIQSGIEAAYAAGNAAEAAKLTRDLAACMARIQGLEAHKFDLDERQRTAAENNRRAAAQQQQPAQQRQTVRQENFSPAAWAWIQAHPAFLSDDRYKNHVIAASYAAEAKGIPLDSADYFAELDAASATFNKPNASTAAAPRPAAGPGAAMPVARRATTAGAPAQPTQRIELSAEQMEAADSLFYDMPADKRYAHYVEMGMKKGQKFN